MTPENFCYWLQGVFEVTDAKTLTEAQVQIIKNHLTLVFDKKTPNVQHTPYKPAIPPLPPNAPLVDFPIGWPQIQPQFHAKITC